jgi:hypothetical protein
MYNPKYVINKPVGNKQITYPTMLYLEKEVPIKLIRLTQPIPRDTNDELDSDRFSKVVYWTNDNFDDILLNLSKPNSREIYTIADRIVSNPRMINPWESDKNCEKQSLKGKADENRRIFDLPPIAPVFEDDFDNYNFYNCYPYKYVYLLEFDDYSDTRAFLDKYVDINYILPTFEEYNPYEFIFYITILGRRMNFFDMKVSTTLIYYISDKLIEHFKPIINQAFSTFSTETLDIIQGPNKIIHNTYDTSKYLYSETVPDLYYNLIGDNNYIWFSSIAYNTKSFKTSDVKIQMCIKEEYIFWVANKLLINLDKIISNHIFAFKFFINHDKYLGHYSFKFPSFKTNLVDEQFEKYIFNRKEYKRELKSNPTIVFYLSSDANIKNVIDTLYRLFPDSENLNFKKISNDVIPRHNFRITQNICMSIGGDNQFKNDYSKLNLTYIDENIPSEYKEIIKIANTCDLTEEQCDLFNKYTDTISGHDLLIYENGECSINNILSHKGIIDDKGSFYNLFRELNLLDYYDKLYNNPDYILFKKNITETNPLKPVLGGYKLKTNKKISKRLSNKRKKRASKN